MKEGATRSPLAWVQVCLVWVSEHEVVGGGTMKRLVRDESTYRRPHFVHFQHMTLVSAYWSLILLAVFVDGGEKVVSSVCFGMLEKQDEAGLEGGYC